MPQEFTGWFIWGIIVLIFIAIIIFLLQGKLTENIGFLKGLMRFGQG